MKRLSFPTPYTILIFMIGLSALATWLLPAGGFDQLTYDDGRFIVSGQNDIVLNADQSTLDSLGLNMDISKFEEGKIRRPVSIPNTYHKTAAGHWF